MATFKSVLAPIDFSDVSTRALELATTVALDQGATLALFHAWEIPAYTYASVGVIAVDCFTPIEEAARGALEKSLADVKKRVPSAKAYLHQGYPVDQILRVARELAIDLIVLGTHGRRGAKHVLLGSVAERVVRCSPVPVLTVGGAAVGAR